MPGRKPKFNMPKNQNNGGNLLQSRPYLEVVTLLAGGTPGRRGSVDDMRRLCISSIRDLLLDRGVHDFNVRIPVTYSERLFLSLLARDVSYNDATQIVAKLEDADNPADLKTEIAAASKEGAGEKIKEWFNRSDK